MWPPSGRPRHICRRFSCAVHRRRPRPLLLPGAEFAASIHRMVASWADVCGIRARLAHGQTCRTCPASRPSPRSARGRLHGSRPRASRDGGHAPAPATKRLSSDGRARRHGGRGEHRGPVDVHVRAASRRRLRDGTRRPRRSSSGARLPRARDIPAGAASLGAADPPPAPVRHLRRTARRGRVRGEVPESSRSDRLDRLGAATGVRAPRRPAGTVRRARREVCCPWSTAERSRDRRHWCG